MGCPTCGDDVVVSANRLHVRVCGETGRAVVGFRCPRCGAAVAKRVTEDGVRVLLAVDEVAVVLDAGAAEQLVAGRPEPKTMRTSARWRRVVRTQRPSWL